MLFVASTLSSGDLLRTFAVNGSCPVFNGSNTAIKKCWIKNVILEKTEVLFCYGKYPILILMKTPIVLAFHAIIR